MRRFWSYVSIDQPDKCWLWTGGLNALGYGSFKIRTHTHRVAHRLMYKLFHGDVADDLCICHRCDNRQCVNPNHLFLGTKIDNAIDRHLKGRDSRGETHPAAKLTEAQVLAIRRDTRKRQEIANHYGVKLCTIEDIIYGRSWRHLTEGRIDRSLLSNVREHHSP